ncbi:MAG: PLP-dependent aminotransferase family protein [Chloroflexi bacterium]|nr:MAG: PLP-dependent aminotransferase family protein [Chloroflexota bacterium]MCQ3935835.1 PLP-dependent aminotransferase family protein [Chloroflexota bacterium]MDL1941096.1 PLP-dependent aminotransferase family protein [Chloroflexi bacterium CFX2]
MTKPLQITQTNIPPGFIDLGAGEPQLDLLPLEILRNAAAHRLGLGEREFLQYGAEQGDGYFRLALAKFLSPRYGFQVLHDELFVTNGISSALDLLCTLYTQPGDTVFVEEPTYFLALRIFADHGLRVASIRTDESGLVMDDLIHALSKSRPKFVYVIPSFQNPSGHTLPPERRERLLALAQEYDFLILADEVYQFLGYTQTPPTSFGARVDSGHVAALGSFSKILAPGLRLGWLHAHPEIIQKIVTCGLLDSAGGLNPFTSAVVRSLIENGDLDGNISHLVSVLGRRMKVMDEAIKRHLPQVKYTSPQGGYFFWLQAPGVDAQELQKKARDYNVGLRPGIRFSSQNGLRDYFRLSISFYDVDEIEQGILRLKESLNEK